MTYGSLIVRLIKDYEKPEEINEQLDKMGYNIGIRLIDDFLAKFCLPPSQTFEEAVSLIKDKALPYYLGLKFPKLTKSSDNNEMIISFVENPLNDYVELPEKYISLWYSNLVCGVIRGALESINIRVECKYTQDTLKGNDINEIRIKLIEIIEDKLTEDEL